MEKLIDGIGKVIFRPSTKAKQINITVKPFEDVVVSVPANTQQKIAEEAVLKNISWINKEQKRMQKVEADFTIFKVRQVFKVQHLSFKIIKKGQTFESVQADHNSNYYFIYIPYHHKIANPKVQAEIRNLIEKVVKAAAKIFLVDQSQQIAKDNNISLSHVSIRKSITRWGSCGTNNTLNLSYYLMFLPLHLIQYAICHELAHIKIKDHSKAYWLHLESLISGAKKLDAEIKKYGIGVF